MKAIGVAAGLALACLVGAAHAENAKLELFRNRLFVPVTVNGTAAEALLDSGAEMTVVDDGFAGRLRLALDDGDEVKGTGGRVPTRFAHGVDISSNGVDLADRDVAVIDLDEVAGRLVGRPVAMILGRDFFDAGRFYLDIDRGELRALGAGEQPRGERFALTTVHGLETLPVRVEDGQPVAAHFDLGNGSDVLVSKAYADRAGLSTPDRIVEKRSGGGLGGAVTRDIVRLKSLRIGDTLFRDVPAAIDGSEGAADVNIGTALLRHFLITVDFPQHALWLEPRP